MTTKIEKREPSDPYVLEDLSEEEAYLYAILTDESGLDAAEFLWYAPDHPDDCFRAWDYQWSWWRHLDQYQIDQCIAEGTLVLTRRGHVPIEAVRVGDEVLTHRGRWRSVTHTWSRGLQDVQEIAGHGHPGLRATPEHEFFLGLEGWRAPKIGDRWATPATFPGSSVPPIPGRGYAPGRPSNVPYDVTSPEFLWLFGHYLAEGSCSSSFGRDGTVNRVALSVHEDERHDVELRLTKAGLRFNTQPVGRERCFNIVINSRQVAEWMAEHGGRGAHGKKLPVWVLGLDIEQRRAVLEGAAFGDGHFRYDAWEYTTVSFELAIGLKLLAQSLDCSVSFRRVRGRVSAIDGREVVGGEQFVIRWKRFDDQVKPHVWRMGLYLQSQIKKVVPAGRVRCYDLEVEGDNSFCVEGIFVHNCARSVGKSLSIKVRGCAFALLHPGIGSEMVITAPELIHLEPIVSLIESQMYSTWFLRELIPRGKSAVTHRPFQMNFVNGARIIGRIPQRDGKGVKGLHPIWLELDEAQDYPKPGWKELNETLKRGAEGSVWRAHGVTRGVRDDFYEKTQDTPDNIWKVHRYPAMWRPTWTDKERADAIHEYGSRDDPDYRRNVLGEHGDATNPIFVAAQLFRNVDQDPLSEYNTNEYFKQVIKSEELELLRVDINHFLDFPAGHLSFMGDVTEREKMRQGKMKPKAIYWVGMDVGFTLDPSEILVWVEYHPSKPTRDKPNVPVPANGKTVLKLLTRLSLWRMPIEQQLLAMLTVIDFYRPKAFSLDKNGIGHPMWQLLQAYLDHFEKGEMDKIPKWFHGFDLQDATTRIKGYSFGEKLVVGIDPTVEVKWFEDAYEKAPERREAKDFSTDLLREFVDGQRLWMPWDDEFLKQFQAATWSLNAGRIDQYGRRQFNKGNDHCLDASREMILGQVQFSIEEVMKAPKKHTPILASWLTDQA